jgi:hypothetical protein
MNYLVSQQIREFGIRLVIGATEGDVLQSTRRAAVLIAAGLCLGLPGRQCSRGHRRAAFGVSASIR